MNILITGITGTIGSKLAQILFQMGHKITGLSRDEYKQAKYPYRDRIKLVLGDVRDIDAVYEAAEDANMIIHTAALKHVDLMESHVGECVKTNVLGTQNVLEAQKTYDIKKVLLLSTDKAVYPINAYGCSKQLAEKLVLSDSRNSVMRYGNVLNSRGSVLELFEKQVTEKNRITITDKLMTRFFISIESVADRIVDCLFMQDTGLFVPAMMSCHVEQLAAAVWDYFKPGTLRHIEYTGIRPGEKINECLVARHEEVRWIGDYAEMHKRDVYSDKMQMYSYDQLLDLVRREFDKMSRL